MTLTCVHGNIRYIPNIDASVELGDLSIDRDWYTVYPERNRIRILERIVNETSNKKEENKMPYPNGITIIEQNAMHAIINLSRVMEEISKTLSEISETLKQMKGGK